MPTATTLPADENGQNDSAAAGAAPLTAGQVSPAAIAAEIIEWDRRGRLVDDESYVQNNAPIVARSFYDLLTALHKLCEPITVAGDAETITACQDLHELICEFAQEAITRATGGK